PSERRIIVGVNWSVGINNPFRQLGAYGQSLDTYLQNQRVGHSEPIVLLLHLACRASTTPTGVSRRSPCAVRSPSWRMTMGKGKSIADDLISGLESVTKTWAKQRKAEERHASAGANRNHRMMRRYRTTQKGVVFEKMEEAYLKASGNGRLPANCRQIYYAI